jgi:putative ABC transport system permease protein
VVRVQAPGGLEKELRAAVASVDPEQRVTSVRTMREVLSETVAQPEFVALLLGLFAGLALVLASVGLYGVIAYSVSQRTHEIGIRMALGAGRREVLKLVVRQGMALALIGVGIGLAAAFGLARFISSLLYEVKPRDPWAYAAVSLALAGVALLASYLPARRATKVDPLTALRYE